MKRILVFTITALVFNITNANYNTVSVDKELSIVADEYEKIKSSELPAVVVDEILKQYPTSKLRQAYKNDKKNTYKLIMVLSSGTARTVYIDSYGRWIQKKKYKL